MDHDFYLKSMGNTASQRAFFSYMAQPQGSYSVSTQRLNACS